MDAPACFGQTWATLMQRMTIVKLLTPLRALALLLTLLTSPAWALGPATYTGTAPVNSQSDDERVQALKTALANVVVAQTGDSSVLARPEVAKAVAQAERYVLQYQYRNNALELLITRRIPDDVAAIEATLRAIAARIDAADGVAKRTLVAQVDSAAVDKMLGRLGIGNPGDEQAALAQTPSEAVVWIAGIRNAEDYARVIGYLARNNFVRAAQPTQARGDGILVKLSLATDLAHFLDAVGLERSLMVNPTAHVDGADAVLALNP